MTALYKVRTVYQKKDVLRMQKLANEKTRRMFFYRRSGGFGGVFGFVVLVKY